MIRKFACLVPLLLLGACATSGNGRPAPRSEGEAYCRNLSASLLGVGEISDQRSTVSHRVGGLSGIEYEKATGRYLLVSDDRGANGGALLYSAWLVLGKGSNPSLRIEKAWTLTMLPADGPATNRSSIDVESIRLLDPGTLLWASEGDDAAGVPPSVIRRRKGSATGRALPLPTMLVPDPKKNTGPRPNRSFEGLAPGYRAGRYFIALEAPLAETDAMPTVSSGGVAPILELDMRGRLHSSFFYPLDPIARQLPGRLADNGISEILTPAPGSFLVLERSGSQQADGSFRYVSRLFCAWHSASGFGTNLRKSLVIDFAAAGVGDFANIEGMTVGPERPDGATTLVLVSDNDFRSDRPNSVIVVTLHPSVPRR